MNITMKILYLRSYDGHSDSRVEKELFSLSKRHEVTFLGWDRSQTKRETLKSEQRINDSFIKFFHIAVKAPIGGGFKKIFSPLIKFWFKEWKFIINEYRKYDAIHACDFDTAFPLLFLPHHPPIVYDIFDYYVDTHSAPKIISKIIRIMENCIIRKSSAVIICSESRKAQIYPEQPQKLVVIHNSPSVIAFKDEKNVDGAESELCRVAYIGSLSEDRFLREMADVISKRNDTELHIGGIGPLEGHFKEISQTCENIKYYGKMKYQDVLALEKRCDILTAIYDPRTPNHKYAAPNKFYESLMLKKPLIMMQNTGMDSFVKEYELGEVIDGDAESFKEGFSQALDKLIAKRNSWNEMGERGYKLYEDRFSWTEMERRLLEIYNNLRC